MKNIIKEGKVKTYKITCPNCGCEFTFNPSDVRDYCGFEEVSCPQYGCEYGITLKDGEYTEVD